jgi:pyridoxine kinase
MSCFGRCALAVIVPIISVLKVQPVIFPTALLSTHTGGFKDFTFLDLTGEIEKIIAHHEELGLTPDCVYTGFLGSGRQIKIIGDYIEKQKSKKSGKSNGTYIFVDPVMADNGKLYSSYTKQMQKGMAELAMSADIITPNMTEAFFLLDREYTEPPYSKNLIEGIMLDLFGKFDKTEKIVITSVVLDSGEYGVAYCERNAVNYVFTRYHKKHYPGSGDMFSSILCAKILNGAELGEAAKSAVGFIDKVMEHTINTGAPVREGLIFEKFLQELK